MVYSFRRRFPPADIDGDDIVLCILCGRIEREQQLLYTDKVYIYCILYAQGISFDNVVVLVIVIVDDVGENLPVDYAHMHTRAHNHGKRDAKDDDVHIRVLGG